MLASEALKLPTDWSRDGRWILFGQEDPKRKTGWDIWALPFEGDRKPFPVLRTPFNENYAVFSPDGRWLAYQSDESGRNEIYLAPFPGPGGKWQISRGGGRDPAWRYDGKGLYYRGTNGNLMEVAITPKGSTAEAGSPHDLFQAGNLEAQTVERDYDVMPDGKRFLVLESEEDTPTPPALVTHWAAGLKK